MPASSSLLPHAVREAFAIGIFVLVYVIISARQARWINLNRPAGVLFGAILMVATGVLPLSEAYRAIDLNTLALLLGTMIVVAYLQQAHFFELMAAYILGRARTPRALLAWLIVASGLLSALFVNDTVCLLLTPVLISVLRHARLRPVPYLLALVMSANIGSAVTLIGNPQNMLVGAYSGLPFARYMLYALPVGVVGLGVVYVIVLALHRHDLPRREVDVGEMPPIHRVYRKIIRRLMLVVVVFILMLLLPVEQFLNVEPRFKLPFVALIAGELAILIGRFRPERALKHVDWSLLLFFAGLFVVVHGVQEAGVMEDLHGWMKPWFGHSVGQNVIAFSGLTLLGSNLVSNVPFVMIARSWMGEFAEPDRMWALLALVSTFAGNLTIVGSVANLIVLEKSKEEATITFWAYLRVGVPVTLATCALAAAWAAVVPIGAA